MAPEFVFAMGQIFGWWQIRWSSVMIGWEIGGQLALRDADDDLVNWDPDRMCGRLEGGQQEYEEWRNWQTDDPELCS